MRTRFSDVRTWAALIALLPAWACSGGRADDIVPSPPPASVASSLPPSPALPPGHPSVGGAAEGGVSGTVSVAPVHAEAARGGRALFLIARAGKDRQIVAVKRVDEIDFPRAFELSPQDAMSHGTAFGGPLEITARLSRSGDAAPAAGDLEGTATGVAPGSQDVRIELRTVRP